MILHIYNLGAIKQMDVDISKNFILFCGPNGTGKTYASYVLFAFLTTNSIKPLECFGRIADSLRTKGEFEIMRDDIQQWLNGICNEVKSQLGSIFGIADETCTRLFGKLEITCDYGEDDFKRTLDFAMDATADDGSNVLKISKASGASVVRVEANTEKALNLQDGSLRTVTLLNNLLDYLAFANNGTARMLTVERNSIYTFKTELSLSRNELIDRIQQNDPHSEINLFEMVSSSSRRYPLAVRSSLRIANDLDNIQKQKSEYAEIASEIERDLLHGEVSMTRNGDVEFHSEGMPKSKRLPFHLSSSIVKTMASLVVFLKHLAHRGDTLIVDEPEMNFHPDVQILLARIFAQLSNSGLRVIVSTHSDYIIREVNNMIMAGVLYERQQGDLAQKDGYEEIWSLKKNIVNVIFFDRKSKYVVTKPLTINDYGFEVKTIDDAINRQNQSAEELYDSLNSIKESKI